MHNSMAVIPSDHMSALKEYGFSCEMTSGAIQNGVPTNVLRCDLILLSCVATPKSASLTWPVPERRMFAAVKS